MVMVSSPDAASVVSLVVLSGTDWETAVACPVATQGDGTWLASLPVTGGTSLMFRLVLVGGNTVESSLPMGRL